jgi:hypothetical protein
MYTSSLFSFREPKTGIISLLLSQRDVLLQQPILRFFDVLGLLLQSLMLLLLLIKLIHGHTVVEECVVSQPRRVRGPQLPLGALLQLLLLLDLPDGCVGRGNQLLLLLLFGKLA